MAEVFKHKAGVVAGSLTAVYTVPAGAQAAVTLLQICNVDGSSDATVDAQVTDTSASNTGYLAKNVVVPDGAPVNLIGGRMFMEAGDLIKLGCSGSASCNYNLSYLEMT